MAPIRKRARIDDDDDDVVDVVSASSNLRLSAVSTLNQFPIISPLLTNTPSNTRRRAFRPTKLPPNHEMLANQAPPRAKTRTSLMRMRKLHRDLPPPSTRSCETMDLNTWRTRKKMMRGLLKHFIEDVVKLVRMSLPRMPSSKKSLASISCATRGSMSNLALSSTSWLV